MASRFVTRRFIEFADTDMAGIVHFSQFYRYMEAAEHQFFRSLGLPMHRNHPDRMEGWARVHASCDFSRPLTYGDTAEIEIRICERGDKSLTYQFLFRRLDANDQAEQPPVARGVMKTVYVTRGPGDSRIRAATIPAAVAAKLAVDPQANEDT